MRLLISSAALGAVTVVGAAQAQQVQQPQVQHQTLDLPVSEFMPYTADSGLKANSAMVATVLFREDIQVNEAEWIRVYFGDVELATGSVVRITSLLDGEVQELDAAAHHGAEPGDREG